MPSDEIVPRYRVHMQQSIEHPTGLIQCACEIISEGEELITKACVLLSIKPLDGVQSF